MKTRILLLSFIVLLLSQFNAQTWQLLIPNSNYDGSLLNLSTSAYNRITNKIYSLKKDQVSSTLYEFNLQNNSVSQIITTNDPSELYAFTYDPILDRIIAAKTGREQVSSVSTNGGSWTNFGTGASDFEYFGAQYFYNETNNSISFIGGYGFMTAKNAVWENGGNSWTEILPNDVNCSSTVPTKRTSVAPVLGSPGSNEIHFLSGQGNCSGNQTEPSCNLGSPWASDVGTWCWLKDLWKYNYSTNTFTQILPTNDPSIQQEGDLAYDYVNNIYYLIGGYIPSPVYNPQVVPNFNSNVYRYRVGIDNGFLPLTINGNAPQTSNINDIGSHAAYFDALSNRIIWIRKDGVYSIELSGVGMEELPEAFQISPNPTHQVLTITTSIELIGKKYTVMDELGRLVSDGTITAAVEKIDVQNLEIGIYFLKIEGLNQSRTFLKW